ncbi:hypothetical protein [uncultured Limosilactobacillus sp.]|uniref:hypothetical protein n=1 Tax=uncultured Limosilactobacillus sp. TaxID=2837629 RepID=UPI0025EC21D9|nr:hypothetical protein [uncultured Limosilactobacillus sp.]
MKTNTSKTYQAAKQIYNELVKLGFDLEPRAGIIYEPKSERREANGTTKTNNE